MSAFLIISILLLAAASYSTLRSKRKSSRAAGYLPDPAPRSLFGPADEPGVSRKEEKAKEEAARREEVLALAAAGNRGALVDAAEMGDAVFYRRALDGAVKSLESKAELSSLSAYLVSHKLRASTALAQRLLEHWKERPSRQGVAELLRVSALSDDAGAFSRAVAGVFDAWRGGKIEGLSSTDLRDLFEAEYWLLSSEAKRSGEGFLLKQQLSDLRRRLQERARRGDSPIGSADSSEPAAQ
ncbi:MAG TPA: hypothetical protein VK422_02200 [Pyrinomonadaceae bacterium]|nr:hypothetical protein [Pyrinomonadaceae bacterium]